MIKRNLFISTIVIIAIALLIVLYQNNPFESVTASDNGGPTVGEPPILINANTEEAFSTRLDGDNSELDIIPVEPNTMQIEKDEPVNLETVRDLLREKINRTLLKPGWVEIHKENISFLEVEDTIVPETGQVIQENYVLSHWVLVNEGHGFDAVYTQGKNMNGEVYYSTFLSNGKQWEEINSEQLKNLDLPFLVDIKFLDDIISLGNSSDIKVDYLTEDGVRVVSITSVLQFPTPVSFNGWEDANVVELETIYYYNWDAGYLIRAEEWITRDDGSRMQANLRKLKVSQVEQISQDVIQILNKQGE